MLVRVQYRVHGNRRTSRRQASAAKSGTASADDAGGGDGSVSQGNTVQILLTTPEHPFWVENRQVWCKAEKLLTGDRCDGSGQSPQRDG